jgi:hypothetical protein
MITNFSQALASLLTLTTANIISPKAILTNKHSYTSHLTLLHVPLTYHKPNIECHPSIVFSMIGYGITITNVTTPLPTNQDPQLSLDCITNYTAKADLSLQDHEQNKLNQPNNFRTLPPISGDDIIGNLLHNQMILTPVAIVSCSMYDSYVDLTMLEISFGARPNIRQHLYGTPPPPIPSRKQFKANRPNAKAMYERANTLPAPIGSFIEAEEQRKQLQPKSTTKTKILWLQHHQ